MAAQLKDKVAIVTGSSSGIGKAIAILLASQGAKVTLCGRDQAKLKAASDEVVKVPGGHQNRVLAVQGDLNSEVVRKQIFDKTVEKFGHVDILVANAGIGGINQTVTTTSEEAYDKLMDTNVKSVFFLIQQAVPHLEKTKGNVTIISSNLTSLIIPVLTVYSVTKAALDHLTRCLAVDLGSKGIRVNSVNPGYIPTSLERDFVEHDDSVSQAIAKLDFEKQSIRLRSLAVTDIANVVAFLSSDAAAFVTGERINVDGGRSFNGPIDPSKLKQ